MSACKRENFTAHLDSVCQVYDDFDKKALKRQLKQLPGVYMSSFMLSCSKTRHVLCRKSMQLLYPVIPANPPLVHIYIFV